MIIIDLILVNSAPDFVHHKQVCSGKALALMQCTLLKSLDVIFLQNQSQGAIFNSNFNFLF